MEEIKEAQQKSSNSFSFARLFCGIIFGSSMFIIASKYLTSGVYVVIIDAHDHA
jgi:hypothetical protein